MGGEFPQLLAPAAPRAAILAPATASEAGPSMQQSTSDSIPLQVKASRPKSLFTGLVVPGNLETATAAIETLKEVVIYNFLEQKKEEPLKGQG